MSNNLLLHFRPRRVPEKALRFTLTWGLGGMAALMLVLQMVTGLLLEFFYEPSPVAAYESIVHIRDTVFMGQLVRNLHHWTGHGLMIVVLLHMVRVFAARAFYPPRHWNWLVGLLLGGLVLLANFSGYLLPWDQLSFWAVTIVTSMFGYIPLIGQTLQEIVRGGEEIGATTLKLSHFIHTGIVPAALLLGMAFHFWYVRKAGGVLLPVSLKQNDGIKEKKLPVSALLVKEFSFAAIVICVLLLFSMLVNAPLGDMANPHITPTTVRAPWYFMGAQELLLHVPAIVAVFVIPLVSTVFLLLLPFGNGEITRRRAFLQSTLFYGGLLLFLGLTLAGIFLRGPAMKLVLPW